MQLVCVILSAWESAVDSRCFWQPHNVSEEITYRLCKVEFLYYEATRLFMCMRIALFICGHTHTQSHHANEQRSVCKYLNLCCSTSNLFKINLPGFNGLGFHFEQRDYYSVRKIPVMTNLTFSFGLKCFILKCCCVTVCNCVCVYLWKNKWKNNGKNNEGILSKHNLMQSNFAQHQQFSLNDHIKSWSINRVEAQQN